MEMNDTLFHSKQVITESQQLCRKKAVEVLVWLLSDADRMWQAEIPHALPVTCAMKGYSLPIRTMRSMLEEVLQACHDGGIHVACTAFDGQFIKLALRDLNDRPLTLAQLQKDVYSEAKANSRATMCSIIANSISACGKG